MSVLEFHSNSLVSAAGAAVLVAAVAVGTGSSASDRSSRPRRGRHVSVSRRPRSFGWRSSGWRDPLGMSGRQPAAPPLGAMTASANENGFWSSYVNVI